MSQARKTIKVGELVDMANEQLAMDNLSQPEKRLICFWIEHILMETHNYQGFQYIELYDPEQHNTGRLKEFDRKYRKHPRLHIRGEQ